MKGEKERAVKHSINIQGHAVLPLFLSKHSRLTDVFTLQNTKANHSQQEMCSSAQTGGVTVS